MNLQEFISEALFQISEGVKNAKNKIGQGQLQINPYITERSGNLNTNQEFLGFADKRVVQLVSFDISVTVETEKGRTGNLKIASSIIEAGLLGKKTTKEQNVSKIKFSVPISFPHSHDK
jgi:hypothetical protein